jgi:superfamily II DNA or RNA helicase
VALGELVALDASGFLEHIHSSAVQGLLSIDELFSHELVQTGCVLGRDSSEALGLVDGQSEAPARSRLRQQRRLVREFLLMEASQDEEAEVIKPGQGLGDVDCVVDEDDVAPARQSSASSAPMPSHELGDVDCVVDEDDVTPARQSSASSAPMPSKGEEERTESQSLLWRVFEDLLFALFHPSWWVRHGAAIGLREVIRGARVAERTMHPQRMEDIATRCLAVLLIDRIDDFSDGTAVAPVRSAAADLLGTVAAGLDDQRLEALLSKVHDLGLHETWQVRHGTALCLHSLIVRLERNVLGAVVKNKTPKCARGSSGGDWLSSQSGEIVKRAIVGNAIALIRDSSEDVIMIACQILHDTFRLVPEWLDEPVSVFVDQPTSSSSTSVFQYLVQRIGEISSSELIDVLSLGMPLVLLSQVVVVHGCFDATKAASATSACAPLLCCFSAHTEQAVREKAWESLENLAFEGLPRIPAHYSTVDAIFRVCCRCLLTETEPLCLTGASTTLRGLISLFEAGVGVVRVAEQVAADLFRALVTTLDGDVPLHPIVGCPPSVITLLTSASEGVESCTLGSVLTAPARIGMTPDRRVCASIVCGFLVRRILQVGAERSSICRVVDDWTATSVAARVTLLVVQHVGYGHCKTPFWLLDSCALDDRPSLERLSRMLTQDDTLEVDELWPEAVSPEDLEAVREDIPALRGLLQALGAFADDEESMKTGPLIPLSRSSDDAISFVGQSAEALHAQQFLPDLAKTDVGDTSSHRWKCLTVPMTVWTHTSALGPAPSHQAGLLRQEFLDTLDRAIATVQETLDTALSYLESTIDCVSARGGRQLLCVSHSVWAGLNGQAMVPLPLTAPGSQLMAVCFARALALSRGAAETGDWFVDALAALSTNADASVVSALIDRITDAASSDSEWQDNGRCLVLGSSIHAVRQLVVDSVIARESNSERLLTCLAAVIRTAGKHHDGDDRAVQRLAAKALGVFLGALGHQSLGMRRVGGAGLKACLPLCNHADLVESPRLCGIFQAAELHRGVEFDLSPLDAARTALNDQSGGIPAVQRRRGADTTSDVPELPLHCQSTAVHLRHYQIVGIGWILGLKRAGLSCLLADEMGLGKTLQALTVAAESLNTPEAAQHWLVVCPASVTTHWQRECSGAFPAIPTHVHHGRQRAARRGALERWLATHRAGIVIASYSLVRADLESLRRSWGGLVLDEVHLLRNPDTAISEAIKELDAPFRLGLTGTPVHNRPLDLWSIFDLILPGIMGSRAWFHQRVGRVVEQAMKEHASEEQHRLAGSALKGVHYVIHPFVLRRLKQDVLPELPSKIVRDVYCRLTSEQEALYQSHVASETSPEDPTGGGGVSLSQLSRLRQVCNHPALVGGSSELTASGKFLALFELLLECGLGSTPVAPPTSPAKRGATPAPDHGSAVLVAGLASRESERHRFVIFAQSPKTLDLVERLVLTDRFPTSATRRIDGSVPAPRRAEIASDFNGDASIDVLLATTSVGGLGLSLTGADIVVFVDHDWNPQVDLQAMDRAHRVGQKRVVQVFRLICSDTLEERIMSLQAIKKRTANTLVSAKSSGASFSALDAFVSSAEWQETSD